MDLATGEWQLRKRQLVPGSDPARYRTARIAVPAADGTQIPVTLLPAGFRRDGTSPCLLYGNGAYEACSRPEFSLPVASLLDRGCLYAVAHVRGGGEEGRRWWLDGRLNRKLNTFTDFIAAADALAADCWAARTRSSPAACPPGACCRGRCSRWPRGGGGRWSRKSRSSIASLTQ